MTIFTPLHRVGCLQFGDEENTKRCVVYFFLGLSKSNSFHAKNYELYFFVYCGVSFHNIM